MRHKNYWTACVGLAALVLVSGCAGTPINIPAVSAADVDVSKGRTIAAAASGFQLFLFIPIGTNDRHARAFEAIEKQAGGDRIADVRIQESWTYALVGTVYSTRMEATAYPTRKETTPHRRR